MTIDCARVHVVDLGGETHIIDPTQIVRCKCFCVHKSFYGQKVHCVTLSTKDDKRDIIVSDALSGEKIINSILSSLGSIECQ